MSESVRGIEDTLALVVDGETVDIMHNVSDFRWRAVQERPKRGFIGRDRQKIDYRLDGYEISWSCEVENGRGWQHHLEQAQRQDAHQAQKRVAIAVVRHYRDGTAEQLIFKLGVVTLDDETRADRESYVKQSWSGDFEKLERKTL